MLKMNTFQASMIILILGIAFGIYALLNTGIDEATRIVNDNLATTPISRLLPLVGVILLAISAFCYYKKK